MINLSNCPPKSSDGGLDFQALIKESGLGAIVDFSPPEDRVAALQRLAQLAAERHLSEAQVEALKKYTKDTLGGQGLEGVHAEIQKAFKKSKGRKSSSEQLVELARATEPFRSAGSDPEAYAIVFLGDHSENMPIKSKAFKRWLARAYYESTGQAPNNQAMQDAIVVLEGQALYGGLEYPIAIRVAEKDGAIWLDLADEKWRAIKITVDGWEIVSEPRVKFIRPRGMLPLPAPERGGSLDEMRPLLNLADAEQWILFCSWLVAALRPGQPYPILAISGEQGSAKTSLCKTARALVDPNEAPLRRPPKDERDLAVGAKSNHVVGLDNVSRLSGDISDLICGIATGVGFSTRELYSDSSEHVFNFRKPVLLNGIAVDSLARPDFADRAIALTLPSIPADSRRCEGDLRNRFEAVRGRVLGAMLDAVVCGLRRVNEVALDRLPRMADFALWIVACEPSLPWGKGEFLEAYDHIRNAASDLVLESPLAQALLSLIEAGAWRGTASQLLEKLTDMVGDHAARNKFWPTTARQLSAELRRLSPTLRERGTEISYDRSGDRNRRRLVIIEDTGNSSSTSSTSSRTLKNKAKTVDRTVDDVDRTVDRTVDDVDRTVDDVDDVDRTVDDVDRTMDGQNAIQVALDDVDDEFPLLSCIGVESRASMSDSVGEAPTRIDDSDMDTGRRMARDGALSAIPEMV